MFKHSVELNLANKKKLFLGNLYSKRDWGHAEDYVMAIWKILQQKNPDDFVICTGKQYTIKQFLNLTAKKLKMSLSWKGKGLNEKAFIKNKPVIEIKKKYFRPSEVDKLVGNYNKEKKIRLEAQA